MTVKNEVTKRRKEVYVIEKGTKRSRNGYWYGRVGKHVICSLKDGKGEERLVRQRFTEVTSNTMK